MKAEKPAEGIMVTGKFDNSKFFQVECSCQADDHTIGFEVEADREFGEISVNTWTTQKTAWWNEVVKPRYDIDNEFLQGLQWFWAGLVNGLGNRLRLTKNIWIDGYVKYESFTIMNKQQALNYAEALKSAIKELESKKTVK